MDLTPLYELRDRLRAGVVAGAELAAEDFRLKRAVEGFAPLEKASPVFAKIGALARSAAAPECEDRAGVLLDAVTLADAVLCTQGAVAVPGEIQEIPVMSWGSAVTNAPYSQLATLLDALENSGGGRYSIVTETHKLYPELFGDYRVKKALVQALGASYAELAEVAERWLKEDSPAIIPLLKKGFDPRGKREAVRRLKVIEALAGAAENEFYLEMLPDSEKETRLALIYALRHTQENEALLLELVRTERGTAKVMAHWALAQLDTPAAWQYFSKLAEKKPQEAAGYLRLSTAAGASMLVAERLSGLLAPFAGGVSGSGEGAGSGGVSGSGEAAGSGGVSGSGEGAGSGRVSGFLKALVSKGKPVPLTEAVARAIDGFVAVLPGKSGEAICDCYRLGAGLGTALDREAEGIKGDWITAVYENSYTRRDIQRNSRVAQFSSVLPVQLHRALLMNPTPELTALAMELYGLYGIEYLPAAVIAMLLTESAEACYEWVRERLQGNSSRSRAAKPQGFKGNSSLGWEAERALSAVCWNEERGKFVLSWISMRDVDDEGTCYLHPLREPLDRRFYGLLMEQARGEMDDILLKWVQPSDRGLCDELGNYFYQRALLEKNPRSYFSHMDACGWTECNGLGMRFVQKNPDVGTWWLVSFLRDMPGSAIARAEESERVAEYLGNRKLHRGMDLEVVKNCVQELKQEAGLLG